MAKVSSLGFGKPVEHFSIQKEIDLSTPPVKTNFENLKKEATQCSKIQVATVFVHRKNVKVKIA